jgi:hypothetical protein
VSQKLILYPLFAMFLLTCIVAGTMLRRRIAFYKTNRVHPQATATSVQMAATMPDSRAPDNFRNLFETPVMFYTIVLAIFAAHLADMASLALAWGYVACRYTHSYIHCTTNIVMRRFHAFVAANTFLIALWLLAGYRLLAKD